MDSTYQRLIIPLIAAAIAFGLARLLKAPASVIKRAAIAGMVFALGNFFFDLAAIHLSLWHYEMPGLIAGTPLDLYLSAGIVFGFITSLIFWWLENKNRYVLYGYLAVLPFLTTARDYLSTRYAYSFLIWDTPYYLIFDFAAWVILLTITFLVFRLPGRSPDKRI